MLPKPGLPFIPSPVLGGLVTCVTTTTADARHAAADTTKACFSAHFYHKNSPKPAHSRKGEIYN
ncbi:hypothetical protein E2C01_002042 [Portunus trituberculatus]|uniref:Uncharacterized protein n=1 Tax=Portunus trituberculatus TaxID=210409 RepID=A0A5B7CKW0_PORTR|nr:hypothetical protein [Portunus trituberculatus]